MLDSEYKYDNILIILLFILFKISRLLVIFSFVNNVSNKGIDMKTVVIYGTSTQFDYALSQVVITKNNGAVITTNDISACGEFRFSLRGGNINNVYNIGNYLTSLNSTGEVYIYGQNNNNTTTALYFAFKETQNIKSIQVKVKNYLNATSTLDISYSVKDCQKEDIINYPNDIIKLSSHSIGSGATTTVTWAK